ncbi:type II CAAX endopeptidase family protein [Streptosporangium sp. NPDC048047]|uniref:CPBP family intramembrane glutamic endopeptidase n=1 Tax=Streptosporangium sp. NPDC048047 TaxID=3155748 RepID=UPI0034322247
MTNTTEGWLLRADEPAPRPRVPAGVEYHRVYAGGKRRILRGILAIVLLFAGLIGFAQLFLIGAAVIDERLLGRTGFTPLQQAAGALSLAVLIPYSMLLQRLLYGVPAGSLHSVSGRFRFGVLGRSLLAFGPLLLLVVSIGFFLIPGEAVPWTAADLVAFIIISALLSPLAAAGEEYGLRGLMFRVVGGWTRGARSGAILGVIVTTVLFSLFHGTLDPYLLTSYLVLFSALAIVTWRTGGLEVAVVLHAIYNATAFVLATALHLDLGGALGSRGEAVGSAENLVPSAGIAVITAIVWWTTRKSGPARTPSA